MRSRAVIWSAALLACALALGGIVALWQWQGSNIGITVGLPAGVTLITSIIAWAVAARPPAGQATPDQLKQARQALAERTLERLRNGTPWPAATSLALPASFGTLQIRWAVSSLNRAGDPALGHTDDAASLAGWLAGGRERRLIILGEPGCGKTTLARQIMAELIVHPRHGDQVPVLFPLATWDVDDCPLADWMHEQIRQAAPELRSKSSYGPGVVATLIRQGTVLPVFDGLDVVPEPARRAVLTSDEFLLPSRSVLTSRTDEFRTAADGLPLTGTVAVAPGRARPEQAETFLGRTAGPPPRWAPVFDEIAAHPHGSLAGALARPRIVCLASTVYRDAGRDPRELIAHQEDVQHYLLGELLRASLAADQAWAASSPWYRDKAQDWLGYLASRICDRHTGELGWRSVFSAVGGFHKWQAWWRAVVGAALVWVVLMLVYLTRHGPDKYGVMTGLAYAFAIASACVFLAPRHNKRHACRPPEDSRCRGLLWCWWWIRDTWLSSWRIAGASGVTFVLYGSTLGLRTVIMHKSSPYMEGISEGVVAALVVALSALIAGIPSPPRSRRNPFSPAKSATLALSLGVFLGLMAAGLALWKHHHTAAHTVAAAAGHHAAVAGHHAAVAGHHAAAAGHHVEQVGVGRSFSYGLIMGLNFGVGTWLVGLTRVWLDRAGRAGPVAALRAERRFALLASLILGLTFASAFGLSADLHWTHDGAISDGLVGVIAGSLASEWPLYAVAVAIIALVRREGPLRLMKFLEMCHQLGVLRPVRASYVFAEDSAALGLTGDPAAETAGGTVAVPVPEPVPLPEPAMVPEPVPQE